MWPKSEAPDPMLPQDLTLMLLPHIIKSKTESVAPNLDHPNVLMSLPNRENPLNDSPLLRLKFACSENSSPKRIFDFTLSELPNLTAERIDMLEPCVQKSNMLSPAPSPMLLTKPALPIMLKPLPTFAIFLIEIEEPTSTSCIMETSPRCFSQPNVEMLLPNLTNALTLMDEPMDIAVITLKLDARRT
jgi:hypothetical protein